MTNIIFKRIYIFDNETKEAYSAEFKIGINIITSSDIDGTDRGKSVLLRSLYHALGADSYYDSKWSEKNKVYILFFSVEDIEYSIYRSQKLFKIFNSTRELIFKTTSRKELALFWGKLFKFSIWLPNKVTNQLEIAPPAYSFLLNFLDQDKYEGTNFNSFKYLAQFSNFKKNVILSHLDIYNREYFEIVKAKEKLESEVRKKEQNTVELISMRRRVSSILDGVSYPETKEALENDLNIEVKKYSVIINKMNEIRNKLIDLRNQLVEQNTTLEQLSKFRTKEENEIKNILISQTCPECNSFLESTFALRSRRYNYIENIISLKDILNIEKARIENEISQNEELYSKLIIDLNEYEKLIGKHNKEIYDYVKFSGLNKLIDEINRDLTNDDVCINALNLEITKLKEKIKSINSKLKNVNSSYYTFIDKMKVKFSLNELDPKSYEKIDRTFCASGSNKPISTVIWYLILNELKQKFNVNRTVFPMVFDSPNNAETDKVKKQALVEYILNSSEQFSQLIISAIGFLPEEYNIPSEVSVIYLNNEKYRLLNKTVYINNYDLLEYMNDA
ncbi:cytoplasmic protein [Veillonella sp. VA142]|uniref:cytoplasmic protein n=1 Tax=Veillonella sp. VA142 TaxID=741834 RepID=UPI000F8C7D89|nr:cytoplasmic protein [Veillonella sp. VA142]